MRRNYLMSDGTTTTDFGNYIRDIVSLEFSIQKYSLPSSDSGFNKIMDGVKSSDVRKTIEYRTDEVLKRLSNNTGMTLSLVSVSDEGLNTYLITINAEEDEYQISISI